MKRPLAPLYLLLGTYKFKRRDSIHTICRYWKFQGFPPISSLARLFVVVPVGRSDRVVSLAAELLMAPTRLLAMNLVWWGNLIIIIDISAFILLSFRVF
jgi:hypothetical protein